MAQIISSASQPLPTIEMDPEVLAQTVGTTVVALMADHLARVGDQRTPS